PGQAEVYLQKAQTGLSDPNMPAFLLTEYYTQLSRLAEYRDQLPPAIMALHQAIANNNSRHMVRCYDGMSQALGYAQNVDLQNHLAELQQKAGQPDSAMLTLQRIFMTAAPGFSPNYSLDNPRLDVLPHSTFLISTLHRKALLLTEKWNKQRDPRARDAALATYRLAIAFVDKLNQGLRWESSKFTLESRAMPLYESVIALLLQLESQEKTGRYAEEAWELADKCKAVTLQEQLASLESQHLNNLPEALTTREKALRQEVAFLEQQVMALKSQADKLQQTSAGQTLTEYQTRLLAVKNKHAALLDSVQTTNGDFYRLHYASTVPSYAQLRTRVLKNNTVLLEYFVGDSTLYVFGLDANGLRYHTEFLDSTLRRQIQQVTEIATQTKQSVADFSRAARALYLHLMAPVLAGGSNLEKIVVIPDGLLGHLPFHLLLDADVPQAIDWRKLPYLLKDKYIRYEYSAGLLLEPLRVESDGESKHNLYGGFAPVYSGKQTLMTRGLDSLVLSRAFPAWRGGEGLPDLRFNRPEVEEAALTLGGQSFLADQATERCFKQMAPYYTILHLAMHAWADDTDPLYSQFAFSADPSGDSTEDGHLHAYELYHLHLRAKLAVLSACQTGAGKAQRGEGILSLSRAFKYAGCPNIVTSLWDADDGATRQIIGEFFEGLKRGAGKDVALAEAQRFFLDDATKEEGHPIHWATFVLIGDDAPVVRPLHRWLIIGLSALFTAIILFFFFFKQPQEQMKV
ncbi:MAG: CHAT domain-containing protein, partial [Saprospiraceae bacterium]